MGIAVKTLLDDMPPGLTAEDRLTYLDDFQPKFFPFATHFVDDLSLCWKLCDALVIGISTLDKELPAETKLAWNNASAYLARRRLDRA